MDINDSMICLSKLLRKGQTYLEVWWKPEYDEFGTLAVSELPPTPYPGPRVTDGLSITGTKWKQKTEAALSVSHTGRTNLKHQMILTAFQVLIHLLLKVGTPRQQLGCRRANIRVIVCQYYPGHQDSTMSKAPQASRSMHRFSLVQLIYSQQASRKFSGAQRSLFCWDVEGGQDTQ